MWIKLIPTWKVLHLDSETQAKGNLEIVYYTKHETERYDIWQ